MADSLFEKIEHQGDSIDKVAEKLEGVSIKDLYALAKRTWDYKDYEMAQKYYNHISLLCPLEWKAPYYASLCNEMKSATYHEWGQRPQHVFRYYESTVEYLMSLDISDQEKIDGIIESSEILLYVLKKYLEMYNDPKNKSEFAAYAPEFKVGVFNAYSKMSKLLKSLPFDAFGDIIARISESWDASFDGIPMEELDEETQKKIKKHGTCYLEYADKAVEKRDKIKQTVYGTLILAISIIWMIALYTKRIVTFGTLLGIPPSIYAVILIMQALLSKNGIRIDSVFNLKRKKVKVTPSGAAVEERCFSPMKLFAVLVIIDVVLCVIYAGVVLINFYDLFGLVGLILTGLQYIIILFSYLERNSYGMIKKYKYNGKFYYI